MNAPAAIQSMLRRGRVTKSVLLSRGSSCEIAQQLRVFSSSQGAQQQQQQHQQYYGGYRNMWDSSSSSSSSSSVVAAAAAAAMATTAAAAGSYAFCDAPKMNPVNGVDVDVAVDEIPTVVNGVKDPMTSYAKYALRRESTKGKEQMEKLIEHEHEQEQQQQQQEQTEEESAEQFEEESLLQMVLELSQLGEKQQEQSQEELVQQCRDKIMQKVQQMQSRQEQQQEQEVRISTQATSPALKKKGSSAKNASYSLSPENEVNVPTMTTAEEMIEEEARKAKKHSGGLKIFSGNGNMALALEIARSLGINLGRATVGRFADGEVNIVIQENVRGKDVYVIQPTCTPVNDNLMELLLMVSTLRRASARRISVVIPYYGYARQDRKMQARVPISAADVARLMESMGVDRVIAVDLHCGQIQGFFGPRVPVDNLDGGIVGLDYFGSKDLHNPVVVSPDAGGVYRAKKFKEGLEQKYDMQDLGLAMIVKQRARAGLIDQMDLVGDVKDCDCIIVDDMIDTAGTLCKAAEVLAANGARRVFAFASHGLLSGPGNDRINNSVLEECVILNTIPTSPQREANGKLTELSVAPLLAQAIFNIHAKKSLSALFK